ncbi:MAG: RIP metalloprotease RseP [Xanthomonadales bacterium]|nr:RIP metalloprotease RseP [Xanthomonadales bacterium]
MTDFFGSIIWLIVALGVLVTFHEFGHYWVARKMGVKVLRFSVGFGKILWRRTDKHGTEFVIAALPLGGYVKFLDERDADVSVTDQGFAFNRKSVGQKIAIVAAGPIFNLILAVVAFWIMFMVGIPELRPVMGQVDGVAATAGIQPGDTFVSVNGEPTITLSHTRLALIGPALDRSDIPVVVKDANGIESTHILPLSRLDDSFEEENLLAGIGLALWRPQRDAVIDQVSPDSPAALAGLRKNDEITSIAGQAVTDWGYIGPLIAQHGSADKDLVIEIRRDSQLQQLLLKPILSTDTGQKRLIIGISAAPLDAGQRQQLEHIWMQLRYPPVEAFGRAVNETWRLTSVTLGMLGRMITGTASLKNISGPITIAKAANQSAKMGVSSFLFFLGLISLSLGILNLLPIPVLDGGHLMYYLVEIVKGSPVSEQTQVAGQYFGLLILAGLMSLAFFNDILRLFN